MRRALALLLAVLLLLLGVYLARRPAASPVEQATAVKGAPLKPEASPARSAPAGATSVGPAAIATKTGPDQNVPTQPAAGPSVSGRAMPLDEIQRVVAVNSVPGRMVFLDFILARTGMRLVGATGAAGRAKPGGSRSGFGFLHYEVFGPAGDLLLSGSVEDPTRRRIEHPAATDDGRITSTVQFSDEGPLAVRIPGEIGAARIVFFRDKNPLAPGALSRENLGEFPLRPQP